MRLHALAQEEEIPETAAMVVQEMGKLELRQQHISNTNAEGDEILILAGGIGGSLGLGSAGGGGGTYVVKVVSEETDYLFFDGRFVEPLIVAGGGAGGYSKLHLHLLENNSCLGGLTMGEYSSNNSDYMGGGGGGGTRKWTGCLLR